MTSSPAPRPSTCRARPPCDKLGYGTGNTPRARHPAGNNVTTSLGRNAASADTDVNSADFTARGALTPDAVRPGHAPTPFTGTIAEIQGNGANATKNGFTRDHHGRGDRALPTGGFNGFYMQTAGSGGAADPTAGRLGRASSCSSARPTSATIPAVGNTANVVGLVKEFNGLTEIDVNTAGGSLADGGAATPIAPHTGALPGTDCVAARHHCLTGTAWRPCRRPTRASSGSPPAHDRHRRLRRLRLRRRRLGHDRVQQHVRRDRPRRQLDRAARRADRGRRRAGPPASPRARRTTRPTSWSSTTPRASPYWNTAGTASDDLPFPWLTPTNPVRVGAPVAVRATR